MYSIDIIGGKVMNYQKNIYKLIVIILFAQIITLTSCQNKDLNTNNVINEMENESNDVEISKNENEHKTNSLLNEENKSRIEPEIETETELELELEIKQKNEANTENEIVLDTEIINSWDIKSEDLRVSVEYKVPEYTPNVSEINVETDLSNVYNINQFSGFTDNQMKNLYENGFVVLKPGDKPNIKMHFLYENLEYDNVPMFITVDSALNMYHLFFDDSLKYVEIDCLYDELSDFTKNMLNKSLKYYNDEKYSELEEELKTVTTYFAINNILLGQETDIPDEIQKLVDEELALISEAEQLTESPLFGYDIDYSQYTVRGHYTGNEKLKNYFKAMMWYGNTAFPLTEKKNENEVLAVDSTIKAMIISSLILEDIENESDLAKWEDIYYITALYAGNSDDLNVFNYRDIITNVYGKNPDILTYKNDTYYDELLQEAQKLIGPQIENKVTSYNMPSGKQFRLMGQRYTIDGDIMQNLMKPFKRPVPSGLDVVAAFGNERAEEILDQYYKPKELWDGYEEELNKLKVQIDNTDVGTWKKDLYSGWLWTLKSTAVSYEDTEGMPQFMRNQMWTDKNINSALGSYAELKHDTVLYSKQPCAEKGGGPIQIPYHYVEPNVEVYSKLLWQAKNTKENLEIKGLLNETTEDILSGMIEMEEILISCSVKELNNELLTDDEYMRLSYYGGFIDMISNRLKYMLSEKGIDGNSFYTTALVSDVATIVDGGYLELGTGFPCEIYVLCSYRGIPYIAKGALYSYYEFLHDERLTDEKWHKMLGISKEKIENYDFNNITIGETLDSLPNMPEWTKSFISNEENGVVLNRNIEIDWKKMIE